MNENFTQTFAALPLGATEAYTLARNSFEACFIEPSVKQAFISQLDETFATFR
jgi:adenosine deaminase